MQGPVNTVDGVGLHSQALSAFAGRSKWRVVLLCHGEELVACDWPMLDVIRTTSGWNHRVLGCCDRLTSWHKTMVDYSQHIPPYHTLRFDPRKLLFRCEWAEKKRLPIFWIFVFLSKSVEPTCRAFLPSRLQPNESKRFECIHLAQLLIHAIFPGVCFYQRLELVVVNLRWASSTILFFKTQVSRTETFEPTLYCSCASCTSTPCYY